VVNTGHATTDEHGHPHWAISERQHAIARWVLETARAPDNSGVKGTAALRKASAEERRAGWEVCATCSKCGHVFLLSHTHWDLMPCEVCHAELTQAGAQ